MDTHSCHTGHPLLTQWTPTPHTLDTHSCHTRHPFLIHQAPVSHTPGTRFSYTRHFCHAKHPFLTGSHPRDARRRAADAGAFAVIAVMKRPDLHHQRVRRIAAFQHRKRCRA
eukprot:360254-Chlamydomonas_euryale.AAC.1